METEETGRVTTEEMIENLQDVYDAHRRNLDDAEVRRFVIDDALVDTGATVLSLCASTG